MILILRTVWVIHIFLMAYGFFTGNAINPTHPYNLGQYFLLLVGFITVWPKHPVSHLICGLSGIFLALMSSYQMYALFRLFRQADHFQSSIGPIVLEGKTAFLALLLPLVLLALSLTLLIKQLLLFSDEDDPADQRDLYDYTKYSLAELQDVERHIDKEKYPQNYLKLVAEIDNRRTAPVIQQEHTETS